MRQQYFFLITTYGSIMLLWYALKFFIVTIISNQVPELQIFKYSNNVSDHLKANQ